MTRDLERRLERAESSLAALGRGRRVDDVIPMLPRAIEALRAPYEGRTAAPEDLAAQAEVNSVFHELVEEYYALPAEVRARGVVPGPLTRLARAYDDALNVVPDATLREMLGIEPIEIPEGDDDY